MTEDVLVVAILVPFLFAAFILRHHFRLKERVLEVEAAQAKATALELEKRVRVLEQIVTDGGAETAAQIEALRQLPQKEGTGR